MFLGRPGGCVPWQNYATVSRPRPASAVKEINGFLFTALHAQYNAAMIRLLAALLITVALGIISRLYPIGNPLYDKSLGDVLYAVAVYLFFALLLSRKHRLFIALLALAWCLTVEAFQATGIPALYAHFWFVRWVIGTDFSWHDVACYFLGASAVVLLDVLLVRRRPVVRERSAADSRSVNVNDTTRERPA